MPIYNLLFGLAGTNNLPVLHQDLIFVPNLAIEAKILVVGKSDWVRVGWAEAVVMGQFGSAIKPVSGKPQRVISGLHDFSMPTPETPYQLRFTPCEWVKAWEIIVYERVIEPTTEPIALDSALIFSKLLDLEAKIDAL